MLPSPDEPDLWGAIAALVRLHRVPSGIVATGASLTVTLSDGREFSTPIYPPATSAQLAGDWEPTPEQIRLLKSLVTGPKSATRLKLVEPNLYRRGRGIAELQEVGLIDKTRAGSWQLTEFGRDFCDENDLQPEDEHDER